MGERIDNDVTNNNVTINFQLHKIIINIFTKVFCWSFKTDLLEYGGWQLVKTVCHKKESFGKTILKQLPNSVSVKKMLACSKNLYSYSKLHYFVTSQHIAAYNKTII